MSGYSKIEESGDGLALFVGLLALSIASSLRNSGSISARQATTVLFIFFTTLMQLAAIELVLLPLRVGLAVRALLQIER